MGVEAPRFRFENMRVIVLCIIAAACFAGAEDYSDEFSETSFPVSHEFSEDTSLEDLDDLDLDLDQQGYGNPINMIKKKALALKKKAMGVIGKLKKKAMGLKGKALAALKAKQAKVKAALKKSVGKMKKAAKHAASKMKKKVKDAVNKGKKKLKSAAGKAKGKIKGKLSFSKLAKLKKSEETSLEDLDDLDLDLDQQGYGNPINMIKKKALALKKKAMGVIGKLKKKAMGLKGKALAALKAKQAKVKAALK